MAGDDITLGTINFLRVNKTKNLLHSVPADIVKKVIIADNGKKTKEKMELYRKDWNFELEVIDLPFNTPPSECVVRIIENVETKYFLLAENDLVLPPNLHDLYKILKSDCKLGGVSGILLNNGYLVNCGAHDIFVEKGYLVRDIRDNIGSKVNIRDNIVYIYFDFIPNATLFRTRIFEDYTFDPQLTFLPHVDFYFGHWNIGKWKFAVCPNVVFQHYPNWDVNEKEYMKFRLNKDRIIKGYRRFLKKWRLKGIIWKKMYISNDIRTLNIITKFKKFLPLSLSSKIDYLVILLRSKRYD